MSARSDKAAFGMALNLGLCILNVVCAIHYHDESDAYLLNAGAAVFCGFFFILNMFSYFAAKFDEDVERTYRRISGK
ncbi:hypothetical protein HWB76_gp061 [Streptomyces phage Blueeyedbeauty]|uniref:Uncharacterized protein n=1 Tax=Streptomyces phage Blueeyedbeauty TaxID=2250336 RepID=A0A345L237_9CAUD|nr:hypothetical protein HWB76_gp061 [Streptomyces phage Blueeyedbeauty]AXH49339.1 hypothetical protein SEA_BLUEEYEDBEAUTY_232 [Streptomyces phage Blueeyedbeauty]